MVNLKNVLQLGILGNVALNPEISNGLKSKPNGLVPIYIPPKGNNDDSFLNEFPLSHSKLKIPTHYDHIKIEPEIVLECDVKYYNRSVLYVIPRRFTVYNNPTLHRLSVHKISQNKNWGENSKGVAIKWIDIKDFEDGGTLANYNMVSFIKRGGIIEPYTVDTQIEGYSYFYDDLIEWIIKQIKDQKDVLSLDNISYLIREAGNPDKFMITLGTTQYTPVGEKTFLEDRDEIFIVMYDRTKYRAESIKAYLLAYKTRNTSYDGMVILHQRAYMDS